MGIAIYARKSSESEDRQVQSLEDQVQALKTVAKNNSLIVHEVIQEARSAKAPNARPEFDRLIRLVHEGSIEGILTWSINRLSRNLVDGGLVAHLLQTGKLKFIRTPERVYLPEDNVLIMSIENGMATSFVQDLSRNVKRGMKGKCERGWYPGAAPIGYKNNFETHEIEIDPVKFPIVSHGWRMMLSGGYSAADVHRELVRMGLKGAQKANRDKAVPISTIYRIFTTPFYSGEFIYNGVKYPGKHQAMITPAEFAQVQSLMGRRQVERPKTKQHFFAGVFRCGECGCSVVGDAKQKTSRTTGIVTHYTYYHCSGAKGCPKHSATEEHIWTEVEDFYGDLNLSERFLTWCRQSLENCLKHDQDSIESKLGALQVRLNQIADRREKLIALRLDGELTADEFHQFKSNLDDEHEKIHQQLSGANGSKQTVIDLIMQKLDSAKKLAQPRQLPREMLKGCLRSVGQNHTLTQGNLDLSLDPLIKKITALEPPVESSGSYEYRVHANSNLVWQGIWDEARNSGLFTNL
jgi:site-specific DNA recombinase